MVVREMASRRVDQQCSSRLVMLLLRPATGYPLLQPSSAAGRPVSCRGRAACGCAALVARDVTRLTAVSHGADAHAATHAATRYSAEESSKKKGGSAANVSSPKNKGFLCRGFWKIRCGVEGGQTRWLGTTTRPPAKAKRTPPLGCSKTHPLQRRAWSP